MNEHTLEVSLALIELTIGIKENNLSIVKEKVDFINANYDPIYKNGDTQLNDTMVISDLLNKYNNESFKYTINHLNNLYNVDVIKWHSKIKELSERRNKNEITVFITDILNKGYAQPNILFDYEINGITRLANIIQDDILLNNIKAYLIQKIGEKNGL